MTPELLTEIKKRLRAYDEAQNVYEKSDARLAIEGQAHGDIEELVAEVDRLRDIVETYDDRFAALNDEKNKEIRQLKNERDQYRADVAFINQEYADAEENNLTRDAMSLALASLRRRAENLQPQLEDHQESEQHLREALRLNYEDNQKLKADLALSLTFRRFKDHKPSDSQQIVFLQVSKFYADIEIRFGSVDYQWAEYDPEDGQPTGASIVCDDPADPPENCRLEVLFSSGVVCHTMDDNDLWAPVEALQNLVDPEEP